MTVTPKFNGQIYKLFHGIFDRDIVIVWVWSVRWTVLAFIYFFLFIIVAMAVVVVPLFALCAPLHGSAFITRIETLYVRLLFLKYGADCIGLLNEYYSWYFMCDFLCSRRFLCASLPMEKYNGLVAAMKRRKKQESHREHRLDDTEKGRCAKSSESI